MATRARRDQGSLLGDRIDILDRNATGPVSVKKIFKTVSAIQALVRDKMVTNKDSVQLADYCFNVCWALKTSIGVESEGDLDESGRTALDDLQKVVSEIERTLRRGASTPRMEYDKDKIEQFKLEVQEVLDDLNSQSSLLDGNSMGKLVLQSPPVDIRDASTASVSEIAFERLIRREFVPDELFSLVENFLTSGDPDHMIRRLSKDDAQTFIDVMDEGLDRSDLPLWARKQCLKLLYRTCGIYALLPTALKVPICYDRSTLALYRGGYADVWKGEYHDQDVAVKVIRTYKNSDLKKILGKFCKEVVTWKTLQHPNVLSLVGVIMSEVQFAMVSDWMPNGNINEFVKADPDTNRLKLLADVARGLIYIHEREMIHGDLKGANILIDEACNARLADFGLLMVLSDPANLMASSSYNQGGTARWMSPELIAPQEFGLKTSRPTKSSDCYSLGMVVYETISGNLPFQEDTDITVFLKVVRGERPRREAGFSRSLWKKLKQCWASQSAERPSIEDVLQCLERCSLLESGRNRSKSKGGESTSTSTHVLTDSDYDEDLRGSEEPPDSVQDEEDVIRCICEDKSDRGEIMIQCDRCMVWQHVMCTMMEVPPDDAGYFCEQCRPDLHPNLFKRSSG